MSQPSATDSKKYFLGIEGEQSGPFTEAEVVLKIRQGAIPLDTLVWYEGLPDWKAIANVDVFRGALEQSSEVTAAPVIESKMHGVEAAEAVAVVQEEAPREKKKKPVARDKASFATDTDSIAPVFGEEEAALSEAPFVRFRFVFISVGLVLLTAITGGYIYLKIQTFSTAEQVKIRPKVRSAAVDARMNALRKAESELGLTPETAVKALQDLIVANATDPTGEKAVNVLVTHYKRLQRPEEAGRTFLAVKQFEHAANFFVEAKKPDLAEQALQEALDDSKRTNRKELIDLSIRLNLGPGGDRSRAMERITQFHKEFPNEPTPYSYYLKAPEERIAEVFSRVSYYYVNTLVAYVATEFSLLNLVSKPTVEVRKGKDGKYRIVGLYRGEVIFNNDRLKNIFLTFWFQNNAWSLVETNVTKERAKWAQSEKKRLEGGATDAQTLVTQLETLFATEFPKLALHDPVPRRDATAVATPAVSIAPAPVAPAAPAPRAAPSRKPATPIPAKKTTKAKPRSGGLAPVPSRNRKKSTETTPRLPKSLRP